MSDIEWLLKVSSSSERKEIIEAVTDELEKRRVRKMANLKKLLAGINDDDLIALLKTKVQKEKRDKPSTEKVKSEYIRLVADKDSKKFLRHAILDYIKENQIFESKIAPALVSEYGIASEIIDDVITFKCQDVEVTRDFAQLVDGGYPFKMFFSLISNTFKQKGVELKKFRDSDFAVLLQKTREEMYENLKV